MTIYVDVLVALNILLTYILLVATRVVVKMPTNKWAVLVAAVIGGISSLVIFYENGGLIFSVVYKILTGGIIVGIGLLPKSPKQFLKGLLAFFGISFLFGGTMYALEITLHPQNILFYNGIAYFDMSLSYLVASVFLIYGLFLLGDYLITKHNQKFGKCDLEIIYNNKSVKTIAFIDTGNTLTDGMSGRPVVIAELSVVLPLFSREEVMFYKKDDFYNIPESLNKNFRLVPCRVITGESILMGFLPTSVRIKNNGKIYETSFCTIALTKNELSQGVYRALINNKIFENVKEENRDEIFI